MYIYVLVLACVCACVCVCVCLFPLQDRTKLCTIHCCPCTSQGAVQKRHTCAPACPRILVRKLCLWYFSFALVFFLKHFHIYIYISTLTYLYTYVYVCFLFVSVCVFLSQTLFHLYSLTHIQHVLVIATLFHALSFFLICAYSHRQRRWRTCDRRASHSHKRQAHHCWK